jgi:hypothetical protein
MQQQSGVLVGVEQKLNRQNQPTGWNRIVLNTGGQYPFRVDTKDLGMVQQALQMVGQQVTVGFSETQSGMNPNTGMPYVNRVLTALTSGGQPFGNLAPVAQMPVQMPQPTPAYPAPAAYTPPSPAMPERQRDLSEGAVRRVVWLSCLQAAATLVSHSADERNKTGESVLSITDALYRRARRVEQGLLEEAPQPPQQPLSPVAQQGMQALQDTNDPGRQEGDPGPVPYDTFPEGF